MTPGTSTEIAHALLDVVGVPLGSTVTATVTGSDDVGSGSGGSETDGNGSVGRRETVRGGSAGDGIPAGLAVDTYATGSATAGALEDATGLPAVPLGAMLGPVDAAVGIGMPGWPPWATVGATPPADGR